MASTAALVTAIRWLGVLWVLDVAAVATGNTFHLLTVAVDTGNLDGGVLQLVLQCHRWGEDDAAGADEASLHVLNLIYRLRA